MTQTTDHAPIAWTLSSGEQPDLVPDLQMVLTQRVLDLLAENARLRGLLKPFARAADKAEAKAALRNPDHPPMKPTDHCGWGIKFKHVRNARAALQEMGVSYDE